MTSITHEYMYEMLTKTKNRALKRISQELKNNMGTWTAQFCPQGRWHAEYGLPCYL
jgi:hypothetical protein